MHISSMWLGMCHIKGENHEKTTGLEKKVIEKNIFIVKKADWYIYRKAIYRIALKNKRRKSI